jgi:hypothetical protein
MRMMTISCESTIVCETQCQGGDPATRLTAEKLFALALVIAPLLVGCGGGSADQPASSRIAKPDTTATAAAKPVVGDAHSETGVVVPVSAGTVLLDAADGGRILTLQMHDNLGRPVSGFTPVVLDVATSEPGHVISLTFYPSSPEAPLFVTRCDVPLQAETSATLRLLTSGEGKVEEHPVRLNFAPDKVPAGPTSLADSLTSPAIHAWALRTLFSQLENISADGPAEAGPAVVDMLAAYAKNSATLVALRRHDAFDEIEANVSAFSREMHEKGAVPWQHFEVLRDRSYAILSVADH